MDGLNRRFSLMRLARNELKIAVAAMCLLVLFAAVYLVIKLTGDSGTVVADAGDQPEVNGSAILDGDPVDDTNTVPIIEETPVDPFETTPTTPPAEAGSAWDDLFAAGSDSPTLMQTPGAVRSDPELSGQPDAARVDDVEPDLARLSAGTTDLPDTPADDPANESADDETDAAPTTNATRPDFSGQRTYIVKDGDSFYTIARDQLGDANLYQAIQQANPLVDPRRIRPGMEIKLPDPQQPSTGSGTRATPNDADIAIDGHVIKAGETLSDIAAEHYGKAHLWRDIYEANRDKLDSPNRLKVGVVLTIPELAE